MLRYLFTFSQTELILFVLLGLAGICLLTFGLLKSKGSPEKEKVDAKEKGDPFKKDKSKQDPSLKAMEVFDYNGTKILHQDGNYTVNDKGVVTNYSNWNLLPKKYQSMVKELDNRSLGEKGEDYFLEILNGFYYVSLPGGKKKRYDTIADIPPNIRKRLGV
ncbi:hypothetical protein [Leptospira ilyithenensis]|uniref:Uncharacterized protein n=1 Tax=Leptospira ilyithenensis TaxID=2484901 RepID=A0A4V6QMR1_9LEPT|nr:hypothetical protein [Leptospira ilyithenensis]TGN06458.1 hypothetical protein EHS11_19075 [Leptospira ilyithenensis]